MRGKKGAKIIQNINKKEQKTKGGFGDKVTAGEKNHK